MGLFGLSHHPMHTTVADLLLRLIETSTSQPLVARPIGKYGALQLPLLIRTRFVTSSNALTIAMKMLLFYRLRSGTHSSNMPFQQSILPPK